MRTFWMWMVLLCASVVPGFAQDTLGVWAERTYSEVYYRHDWGKGHLLLETFSPQLDQLTIGLGREPAEFEWQMRINDADQLWLGASAGANAGSVLLQSRVLIGANSRTPSWYELTAHWQVDKNWGIHIYTVAKEGSEDHAYVGPSWCHGQSWMWFGVGEGGYAVVVQYSF